MISTNTSIRSWIWSIKNIFITFVMIKVLHVFMIESRTAFCFAFTTMIALDIKTSFMSLSFMTFSNSSDCFSSSTCFNSNNCFNSSFNEKSLISLFYFLSLSCSLLMTFFNMRFEKWSYEKLESNVTCSIQRTRDNAT
jgi:hypothetical protein